MTPTLLRQKREGRRVHTNLVCNFRGFLCGGFRHNWGYM